MDIIGEITMERDHMELSLGDTLDVKAGIVLAAITVLGTLTGTLLALTVGGGFSVLVGGCDGCCGRGVGLLAI